MRMLKKLPRVSVWAPWAPNFERQFAHAIKRSRARSTATKLFFPSVFLLSLLATRRYASLGCRRGSSGFRDVRSRPNGTFYTELRASGFRITLGTYDMSGLASCAYDAAAWRLWLPRRDLNLFRRVVPREGGVSLPLFAPRHRRGPSPTARRSVGFSSPSVMSA
jgi:hypothetical protein